jgi:hypothetical protein
LKKQHKIVFLTLTIPYKQKKGEKLNPKLNIFLTNLRKNYGLKNYIWTRENQKNGRLHYHILADLPYAPIQKINTAWCEAINHYSSNAVRLPADHRAIVNDLERTVKYVSKYITKDQNEKFPERCYAISQDIKLKPIRLSYFDFRTIHEDHKKDMRYKVYEHCTTVKIWDFFSKSDYFVSFLGNLAENSESLTNQGETVKLIESMDRGEAKHPPAQFSLFGGSP